MRIAILTLLIFNLQTAFAASVVPLFDANSNVTNALISFRVTDANAADIRRYEVEGASPDECRLSRDPFYNDVFHLKCASPKQGIRLVFTLFVGGQIETFSSDPLSIRNVVDGSVELKPVSRSGL